MNEKYFTERLFWLERVNTLLHVVFVSGYGWVALHENPNDADAPYFATVVADTYAGLMRDYEHRNPELLLQEEG